MQSIDRASVPTYQVMALFAGSVLSFRLPNGATFADLADRLDHLDEQHIGVPMAILVKLRTAGDPSLSFNRGLSLTNTERHHRSSGAATVTRRLIEGSTMNND